MKEARDEQDGSPVVDFHQLSPLDEIVHNGAQRLLQQALEIEIDVAMERLNRPGRAGGEPARAVRNGHMPEREVATGAGSLKIRRPRMVDRDGEEPFSSAILPPYVRRSPSVDELVPVLYLHGISTGDMSAALEPLLGPGAKDLSPSVVTRLKETWVAEEKAWSGRSLQGKRYVYLWADGVHFNVRLGEDRTCILVLIGALEDGTKELVAVCAGRRESTQSWREVLVDLHARGLTAAPELAVGDGALGFWAALGEVYPQTRQQRCWVHKTGNVLDKLPKRSQPAAKRKIHNIYLAETEAEAHAAFDKFIRTYEDKFPKAVGCLLKDKDQLFSFYHFPAAHWRHIRTTNPIESTFATVRHRTRQTKGCGTEAATLAMVFKLGIKAQKYWRRLNGSELLGKVISGVKFVDGIEVDKTGKPVARKTA